MRAVAASSNSGGTVSPSQQPPLLGAPPDAQQGLPNPIKELVEYPFTVSSSWWLLAGVFSLCLVLAATCYFVIRRYRQRLSSKESPKDTLGDLVNTLGALAPGSQFSPNQAPEYFFSLGLTFRQVLENAFDFPATDYTLQELKTHLKGGDRELTPQVDSVKIIEFFERCDLIKFAKSPSSAAEAVRSHQFVYEWAQIILENHRQGSSHQKSPESTAKV